MRRAASKAPQQMKVQRRLDLLPKGDSHQQRETEATNFTTVSRTGSGRVTTFRLIAAPLICLKCEYFTFKRSLLPISISISIHLHSFIPAPSLIAAGAFLRFSFSSFPALSAFHAKQKLILATPHGEGLQEFSLLISFSFGLCH